MFLEQRFDSNKVDLPSADYIKTINESHYVRHKYYGVNTQYTGTVFTELCDKTISDNSPFYKDSTIDETIDYLETGFELWMFWVIWIIVIGLCVETIDYIKCMTLTQNVDPTIYDYLTVANLDEINRYIEAPMTASSVPDDNTSPSSRERVTSELIYYWMIALNIPFECQKWHLNRLLMLIRICNFKNQKPKKMSKRELYGRHAAINAANRKRFHSKG